MRARDIPNLITLFRIVLVVPVVLALLAEHYLLALLLAVVAGLSDGIDGWLARRFDWHSRLGAILDPIADKLLLVSCYLSLGWVGVLPSWLVVLVIGRDLVILTGAVAYHLLIGRLQVEPTLISKLNTFFQIVLVVAVMISLGLYPLTPSLLQTLLYAVAVSTIISGSHYVWVWSRRALASWHGKVA